jgi:hypothetical protein
VNQEPNGVGLRFTCPQHGGSLYVAWLDLDADEVQFIPAKSRGGSVAGFGGARVAPGGSWHVDGRGADGRITVFCPKPGCRQSQTVALEWFDKRLRQIAAAFLEGRGPRVPRLPLSEVGTHRSTG